MNKAIPHDSAKLHVTGAARYVDDIPIPAKTLHLAFGLSNIAKGKIKSIDLSAVREAPGVADIILSHDLPFKNDVAPNANDEPLLADMNVNFIGQPIFIVAANSHTEARYAAKLAIIEYTEEKPILSINEAINLNSRFEDGPRIYEKGDILSALKAAPMTLEGKLELGGQEHFYLEGQAAIASPQDDGEMVIYSSTQHPTEIQHKVAETLGLDMNLVKVEVRRMGGGFGGKESQGNALACACAIAAVRNNSTVKMRYDRDDDMKITGKRHDFRIEYTAGFDKLGNIKALDVKHFVRCGWSQDLSLPVADRAMLHADNCYHIPNFRVESHRLKTNTQSATAFRGFGGPQGMIGMESIIDHIAFTIGADPDEVRKRNFYRAEKKIKDGVKPQKSHYNMEIKDFIVHEMMDKLLKDCDYQTRKHKVKEWNRENKILKRGIAFNPVKFGISFTLTQLNQAGALVHIYNDGSVKINHGGTEMGQGLFQKVAQVAAHVFGIETNKVQITATDTAKVPNTSATAASSGSDLNGMAVKQACDIICARISSYFIEKYRPNTNDVKFEDGRVKGSNFDIAFEDAVHEIYTQRISLSSTGFYKTPDLQWDRIEGKGRPFYYFAYGAAVSEVVVDTLTGEFKLLRTDILHDAGKSLNPAIDVGQIEGGFIQSVGWLTTEELVWDEKGDLKTHAPSTYKIPCASDRPKIFNVRLFDNLNLENTIYKSKAVGEPPFMLGISVFLAIRDAISACGKSWPNLNAPATPENILKAIRYVDGT